jgi:hypothetical protein
MSIYTTFLIFWLGNVYFPTDHPVHVSRTEINISDVDKAVQVSARIYTDDLELALKQKFKKAIKLHIANEQSDADKLLLNYINDKFQLVVDGKPVTLTMIGKEQSEDYLATWCYLESSLKNTPKTIDVTNHILQDLYDDQKNMVEVSINGRRKNSFILDISDGVKKVGL